MSEMRSSDRVGGGYVNYTTQPVPYQLSLLTQTVLGQLDHGITGEMLWNLLHPATDSDLQKLQKDLSILKVQDSVRGKKEVLDFFSALDQMASAELERRKPGPRLLSRLLDLLGADSSEVRSLLESASTDALRELPKCLDQLLSDVRAAQAKKLSWFGRVKQRMGLPPAADGIEQARQLDAFVESVKVMSAKIAKQRGAAVGGTGR